MEKNLNNLIEEKEIIQDQIENKKMIKVCLLTNKRLRLPRKKKK